MSTTPSSGSDRILFSAKLSQPSSSQVDSNTKTWRVVICVQNENWVISSIGKGFTSKVEWVAGSGVPDLDPEGR